MATRPLLENVLSHYRAHDKHSVTIAVGCTGGKHRSVAIAEALGQALRDQDIAVRVTHRDRTRLMTLPHVVALGGGHGLYASLTALRPVTETLTAIVTVADDGGSSGRLREELGVVPPGDLRMALSALCEDTEWGTTWRDVLQSRFATDGALDGHAVGNLLIAALWEQTGDVVEGLDWVARLLRAQGRVLPVSDEPVSISAVVDGPDWHAYRVRAGRSGAGSGPHREHRARADYPARAARDAGGDSVGRRCGVGAGKLVHVGARSLSGAGSAPCAGYRVKAIGADSQHR